MLHKFSFIFLSSLLLLLLLHSCIAWKSDLEEQQNCNFNGLNALQPTSRVESQGGSTEFWNPYDKHFRCAGVAFLKHTIRRRGLVLPSYTNSVLMLIIQQGRGILGAVLPGCPETFQSPQEERRDGPRDRHQKIHYFRKGDMIIIPAGVAHWIYNNGDQDVQVVVMFHTIHVANMLNPIPQRYFLLGNPQGRQEQGQQEQLIQQIPGANILGGFDTEILADAFNLDVDIAEMLMGEDVTGGAIVRVETELRVERPERQQQQELVQDNGLEEMMSCSIRISTNLDNLEEANIFNPQAGHLISINSHHLPILADVKLSAERGHLRKNAIVAPHWVSNAHSIIYPTDGEARVQIVNYEGKRVFDGRLQKGQLVLVPQYFAVMIQAGKQGFEWVSFKTNDKAVITPIAGRGSVFRGLPLSVFANILPISQDEASTLKYNNTQAIICAPRQRSQFRGMLA